MKENIIEDKITNPFDLYIGGQTIDTDTNREVIFSRCVCKFDKESHAILVKEQNSLEWVRVDEFFENKARQLFKLIGMQFISALARDCAEQQKEG
jgi:hypothetical protein